MQIPTILVRYFDAATHHNGSAAAECFLADAKVHDENRDYVGRDQIRDWIDETSRKYQPNFEVLHAKLGKREDGSLRMTAKVRVSGTFPVTPVELDFAFALRDGLIASLNIG